VPPGTVGAFDRFGQYENLSEEERDRLRAVIVDHDNDPIAQVSFRWAVKCPPWLSGDDRGRGVPAGMDWVPLITFVQIAIDATNAMRVVPGQFKSFGHDYRGDTAEFVHAAYRLPTVSDEQMAAVVEALLGDAVGRAARWADEMHGRLPVHAPGRAPSLRMIVSSMHHLVSALCSRLTPTKAVNASHHSLTKTGLPGMPSASETRMKRPANRRTSCQDAMVSISF